MSGADRLLPCPFCGETETYVDGSADCTGTPMAGCLHCGAHIPHASRTEAIAAWNRRASHADPAPVAGCEWCVDGVQADGETPCPCTQAAPAPSDGLREAERGRDAQKLIAGFMLDCNEIGLSGASENLVRCIKEQCANYAAEERAALSAPHEQQEPDSHA